MLRLPCLPCLIVVPCSGAPSRSSPPHKGGGELTLRDRYFSYIYSTYHQQVLQEKRGRNDIWRGLYQFPLFESDSPQTPEAVAHWVEDELSYSGGALRLQLSALSTGSPTKYFTLPSTPPNSSPTPWGAPSTNG